MCKRYGILALRDISSLEITYFTVVTTAWVDPDTNVLSDTVCGGSDEVATGIVVKGAEIAGIDGPGFEPRTGGLEAGGGLLPVVRGIFTDSVPEEELGTEPGMVSLMVPGVTTGAVPNSTGVEKFPFGILYVMLSDGTDTDGIDAGADGGGARLDVDGWLCGPPDGGPQSKLTLWIPTSHPDRFTCFGS